MTELFSGIVGHAQNISLFRCPYRDRRDHCTAEFLCSNQEDGPDGARSVCGHDGALDYRSAWESKPKSVDYARDKIRQIRREAAERRAGTAPAAAGTIRAEASACPSRFGAALFDFADDMKIEVASSCQRLGKCHECIVEVLSGDAALSPRTEAEGFLQGNFRLACQAAVTDADADIAFKPLRRKPRILTAEFDTQVRDLAPLVERRDGSVFYDGEEIDRDRGGIHGIAVDLGTTTVAMELFDLETGTGLAASSFENPQRFGGSDVMNRISYDGRPAAKGELQKAVVSMMNREIMEMTHKVGIKRQTIYEIVIAGNSTMRDILFGLDVQGIGQKPYKSLIENEYLEGKREHTALTALAWDTGLRAGRPTRIYGLPLIGSHVGADAAACLAALDFPEGRTTMLVDIGTNTEVILAHEGRMIAASCPAGPAFEGGLVKFGMSAYDGAIETIRIAGGRFDYKTIGDAPAEGLCGSGLIDLLAELRRAEILTPKGVFAADRKLREIDIAPERGITFSKEDASNLAQAKSANYCGQYIVLRAAGVDPAAVDRLYLAGGFATYIDAENAVEIGLLAPVNPRRIEKVGNAALKGARAVLLSRAKRAALLERVKRIDHIELESTPDFFDLFVEGCQFKPMPATVRAKPDRIAT